MWSIRKDLKVEYPKQFLSPELSPWSSLDPRCILLVMMTMMMVIMMMIMIFDLRCILLVMVTMMMVIMMMMMIFDLRCILSMPHSSILFTIMFCFSATRALTQFMIFRRNNLQTTFPLPSKLQKRKWREAYSMFRGKICEKKALCRSEEKNTVQGGNWLPDVLDGKARLALPGIFSRILATRVIFQEKKGLWVEFQSTFALNSYSEQHEIILVTRATIPLDVGFQSFPPMDLNIFWFVFEHFCWSMFNFPDK